MLVSTQGRPPSDGAPERIHHQDDSQGGLYKVNWELEPLSRVQRDKDPPPWSAEDGNILAPTRAVLLYVNLAGPMPATSLGCNNYAIIIVDDYSRSTMPKFSKSKNCKMAALESYIADHITPAGLTMGAIRTDKGGEFWEPSSASEFGITQLMPPAIPQFNGVVERAPGLLREKTNALPQEAGNGRARRQTNISLTTSDANGVTPYEMWYGRPPCGRPSQLG